MQDENLSAIEKLKHILPQPADGKPHRKTYLLGLLRVWYADENAIVRQKVFSKAFERITPMLTRIIQQGIREGILTTPILTGPVRSSSPCSRAVGDTISKLILAYDGNGASLEQAQMTVAVYISALERVLGVPSGSLILMDADVLEEWFSPSAVKNQPPGVMGRMADW